jgi:phospholipase/carboxylesterase
MEGAVFAPKEGKSPKKLIIVMHGYGASAEDLWPIGYEISKTLPEAEVLLPHAFDPCEAGGGGRQWFKMGNWTLPEWKVQLAQVKKRFEDYLLPLLKERHLTLQDVALVGFSQGAMMALHFGLQEGVRAVVSFSGVLVDPDVQKSPSLPAILLVHGDSDSVLRTQYFFQTQEALRAQQIPFEALLVPNMGHSIDPESLQKACDFLEKHLTS